ncbi:ParA family protein [Streptomyces sp. NPDC007063]|uniref:ParA family protein n=1 Tax=Streptomyces sp. NPDC007063 TaxID=3364772 RepID=UPI0036A24849
MAKRVAIGTNKGGDGKSATAVRLTEALAQGQLPSGRRPRIGVVDMDPQGNASRRLGWVDTGKQPTVNEAIKADTKGVAADLWQPIGWTAEFAERIVLLPARLTLENRIKEAGETGAWRRLSKALKGADDHLDYVLIDCHSQFSHLAQLALAAAHHTLSSSQADLDSLNSARRYRDFVVERGEDLANDDLDWLGVILSQVDSRNSGEVQQVKNARELFGEEKVWGIVPRMTLLHYADEDAKPLCQVRDSTRARAPWELLAQRFIKEVPAR